MRGHRFGMRRRRALWIGTIVVATVTWSGFVGARVASHDSRPNTGMAAPAALMSAFDRFAAGDSAPKIVSLSLSNLRGLSSEAVNAGGGVTVDLATGTVDSVVQLLPADDPFDLWLIDNQPGGGRTTFAEDGDGLLKIGTYAAAAGGHQLSASLGAAAFTSFFPDRAFVVRSGSSPVDGFVLTGPSTLFTRLRHRQVRFVDNEDAPSGFSPIAGARAANFDRLIAQGRELFLKDTFEGNGRTCATCHVEANNFTVDPAHIATLPRTDPLFVAETNPALATLERSDMLKKFGLVLVNADGFDASRGFVFRAPQNVQALANSMTPQNPIFGIDFSTNGRNPNPPERLGWGNDGPPLRDFALVAIAQHAPTTLGRRAGLDFRVPTDEELDGLAAYQLALGRQEDFDLKVLELKSAVATNGMTLFLDSGNLFEPGHKNCNACHFNGGGTAALSLNPTIPGFPRLDGSPHGFNIASPTNANDIPLAVSLGLPRDGGFGQVPTVFGSFGNTDDLPPPFGHFELEEFNSPPVVESADTGPFFHNHSSPDLESAVAFYGSDAFKNGLVPAAIPIDISADPANPDVQAIAAFLRVLNALENIRSSIDVAERGRTMTKVADLRELARLSLAETVDALEVLSQGAFAKLGEPAIRSAKTRLRAARVALEVAHRLPVRWAIDHLLGVAIQQLRRARAALANPATLPESFRN
jgi:cytochrome c peroxidase